MIAFYQLPMSCPRKAKRHYFVRPILDKGGAKCLLVHVGTDFLAPTRRELVELVVRLGCIATSVALEVVQVTSIRLSLASSTNRSNDSAPKL